MQLMKMTQPFLQLMKMTQPFLWTRQYLCYGFFSYVCILFLIFDEMAVIRPLNGIVPKIGRNCFIAENAAIIGDVEIGDDCSIWYGAVLRGDVNPIRLGNRVNIQDGAVLHTLYRKSVVEIGDDVSVGHNAVIHGAKVGNIHHSRRSGGPEQLEIGARGLCRCPCQEGQGRD